MGGNRIELQTPDGLAPAATFAPPSPRQKRPGIIVYMDAFGLRPAITEIGEWLAEDGYYVIIPDLFYRFGDYGTFDPIATQSSEESLAKIRQMMAGTSQEMTQQDTSAFIDALRGVGASGPIGALGYCMGGARALNAAARYPESIVATASIHGGNLATDASDSPHKTASRMGARVYVAMAGVDKSFPPEQSSRLEFALRTASVDYLMENYRGMGHGWAISDHSAFDPAGSARHRGRLSTFLAECL